MPLDVICGPMFSGKTALVIDRLAASRELGRTVAAFLPAEDTRSERLVSHSGAAFPAAPWLAGASLTELTGAADVVGVDEAQFLDAERVDELIALGRTDCAVLVAGLDLDFRRRPFAPIERLLASADAVQRLTATCGRCLRPAPFTQRLIDGRPAPLDDPLIRVGGEELYSPRCARCYEQERAAS